MTKFQEKFGPSFISIVELVIQLSIAGGIVVYAVNSFSVLSLMDWGSSAAFQELIERALLVLVGVEIIQILRLHEMRDIFLIALFLLSRKALDPTAPSAEVLMLVGGIIFTISVWSILTTKRYLNPSSPL